ncbi:MAG: hypothetical protein ASARMPREDX12_008481 [Alectoria sarmentosa]|nr:MAG: hypothetical protein ASARMPREDX12_008481 [Alectoria sarmentosa]
MDGFSTRGASNLIEIMARIPESILSPSSNTDEINLSTAENWVIRNEVLDILKSSFEKGLQAHHLDWPRGFWGDPELLEILAEVFNKYFKAHATVEPNNVVVGPGAAACLDAILYNICDSGDGVLVPCPYWSMVKCPNRWENITDELSYVDGYDAFFRTHSGVNPVSVPMPKLEESLGPDLIAALEEKYQSSTRPIKALVLSNPHNPLGRCYSKDTLEQCLKFCQQHEIHLISDEVFALSVFASADLADPSTFVSALSLHPKLLDCDPGRVHVVWSISKDLAATGVRLACIATQNKDLRDAVALIASVNVSTLSTIVSKELLTCSRLPSLLQLNSIRLAEAYVTLTSFFKTSGISYFPSNSTTFVMAKLAPLAQSWGDEEDALRQYLQAGVLVAPGRAYHVPEDQKGWMRVSFAVNKTLLAEAIIRIGRVFQGMRPGKKANEEEVSKD